MSEQPEDVRHQNPSGITDEGSKQPQPVDEQHHEEGHVDPEPEQGEAVVESPS